MPCQLWYIKNPASATELLSVHFSAEYKEQKTHEIWKTVK